MFFLNKGGDNLKFKFKIFFGARLLKVYRRPSTNESYCNKLLL